MLLWRVAGGPHLEREFQFHTSRKWRSDFAHMPTRTLIEIEGGIFMRKTGRHNRGAGYAKEAEKGYSAFSVVLFTITLLASAYVLKPKAMALSRGLTSGMGGASGGLTRSFGFKKA